MTRTTAGNLWLLLFAISFTASTLIFRAAGKFDIRPLILLQGGLAVGAILVLPFCIRRIMKTNVPISKPIIVDLGVLILCEAIVPYWLQIEGLRHTTATKSGIILTLIPVITMVLSKLILDRTPSKALILNIIGMVFGGILISYEGQVGGINLGDWMIFGSACSLALAAVITHRLVEQWPSEVILQTRMVGGFIFLLPITLSLEPLSAWSHPDLSIFIVGSGIFLSVFTISIYEGIRLMGPEYAVLYDIVAALMTAVGAYLLWGEILGTIQLIGAIIILTLTLRLFFKGSQTT